uniref:Uncharacterized protein n=1 Tax=Attheya septentrionalis TaxID=420275 RepID=A0A7S2XMK9_9STRA|mmetsp:Transcript_21278/g.38443  ORF Transcript_21278/g.38443 Transcript_21278/m.38443 type:complete len:230 (+) Transcript_21278:183-872(+)|eukprot:CAMPEP_0198304228 /NCGR_PEP_ID=MMETSP1449-20131203/57291_1 /TAXON_ID=420275 /ORGANISM="Attheya septentrionalis, Strain CCMP2084" /LENGTH=229 /DNA_ID=CAMNT_0044006743 /DNA_START=884 /DNA_END=1573 /DNA_ORIENTATION=+
MMNLFGKKKAPVASAVSSTSSSGGSDPSTAVVTLRQSIKTQEKREEHLQRKVDAMVAEAKAKMAKKDKKGALFSLKRKKLYEQEIDKIQNVKMTLETQVMNIESASQNAETFKAMATGTQTMKNIRNDVGVEKVDDMMDDIKEEMEMANEISNAIAQPIDPLLADEDELLAELNALEEEDLESELLAEPAKTQEMRLPDVPVSKLPTLAGATADEEAELRQLEAEIAGM